MQDVFLYGVIVPVIPFAIRVRANVAEENVQHWVSILLGVYGGALLVAAPIFGWLADQTDSRRSPLLVGLLVLAGSTIMLCLGKSIGVLLAGRLLQGGSAAVVWTVALALLSDTVSKDESGQALGYVALSYSLGVLVAPLLGGVVYARAGYYAVFAMTFAVIALDIVLRLLLIEKKVAEKWLQKSPSKQDRDDNQVELRSIKASSPIAAKTENTATGAATSEPSCEPPKRKLPTMLILLKSKRILAAFWGNLVAAASIGAFDSTLPIFVNKVFGWNSLGAGLIFIAIVVPNFASPLIGRYLSAIFRCKLTVFRPLDRQAWTALARSRRFAHVATVLGPSTIC